MASDQIDLAPDGAKPREPRYESRRGGDAKVVIERGIGGEREEIAAELLDVSRGGAKLSVAACIPFEEAVQLKIDVPDLNVELVIAADVCWTRPAGEEGWILGCSFKPKLPEDALNQLAQGGYVDRRRHARFPLALRATACWELGETSIPVRLQDASEGGFAMLSPQLGETGQRLLLHLSLPSGLPVSIPAKIQWRLKTEDEHLIGCSFANEKDFEHLRSAAPLEESEEDVECATSVERSPWFMYGAVAATTFFATYAYLLFNRTTKPQPFEQISVAELDSQAAPTPLGSEVSTEVESDQDDSVHLEVTDGPASAALSGSAERLEREPRSDPSVGDSVTSGGRQHEPVPEPEPADMSVPALENADQVAPPLDDPYSPLKAESIRLSDPALPLSVDDAFGGPSPLRFESATDDAWPPALDLNDSGDRPLDDDWAAGGPQSFSSVPLSVPGDAEAIDREFFESALTPPPAGLERPDHLDTRSPTEPAAMPVVPPPPLVEAAAAPGEFDHEGELPPPPQQPLQDPRRAAELFYHASDLYRRGDIAASASEFRRAAELDRQNALYVYLTALAEYQLGRTADADRSVARAAELEETHPVKYWGSVMRRYQGQARSWLEQARAEARAAE